MEKSPYFEMDPKWAHSKNPEERKKGILDILDDAVHDGHEGIMLKSANSVYKLERSGAWIKMKPDYFDDNSQTMDVLILGAYNPKSVKDKG